MVRFHQLLALILLLAVTASGQVVTSDAGALTSRVWGATVNVPWYLRTIVVQGATPLDLTDRYVSFTVRQVDTEALVHSSTGTIHVVNPGEVIFTWTPRAPGTFAAAAVIRRTDTGETVANIMDDTITVTNPPGAGAIVGNLTELWDIQGDGDLAPDGTDRTIVPRTDLGASLGRTNERYDEAHARVGYFDSLIAGTVSVENAIGFLDNTKVKLTGETNTVDLTNTSLQVRSPTNATEAATKGYVDAVAGGTTNIGTVQLYTNAGGAIVLINPAGYEEPISLTRHVSTPTPTIRRSYDSQDTWSNLNAASSAWGWASNGMAHATSSNAAATGRFFDYQPVTSGTWVRWSVRIVQLMNQGFSTAATRNQGFAWRDYGGTNNFFGAYNSGVAGNDLLESYIYNLSYSAGQDTRYVTPYQAGSANIYLYLGTHNYYFFGDHDGTNKVRYYIGYSPDAPICAYYATNVQPMQGVSMVINQSAGQAGIATNLVNTPLIWDDFTIEEGQLWLAPFSHN